MLTGEASPSKFENDPLTEAIIGAAIEVHRLLGPGLLESPYEECLCYELAELNLALSGNRSCQLSTRISR